MRYIRQSGMAAGGKLNMKKRFDTKKLVGIALFTAIVVVLQLLGSFIRFGPFSISLVLVPIVVGAALYGPAAGAWLGGVFGLVVLLSGDAGAFLAVSPIGTIIVVMVKGIGAGLVAGFIYRAIAGKSESKPRLWIGTIVAAIAAPVVNTGIFLIGGWVFFLDTIAGWAQAMGFGDNVAAYMFLGLVGANFLFELLVNVVLSPVIVRIIKLRKKVK